MAQLSFNPSPSRVERLSSPFYMAPDCSTGYSRFVAHTATLPGLPTRITQNCPNRLFIVSILCLPFSENPDCIAMRLARGSPSETVSAYQHYVIMAWAELQLDLLPVLSQTVRTQEPANGE